MVTAGFGVVHLGVIWGIFGGNFWSFGGDFSKEGIVAANAKMFVCECCRHLAILGGSGENLKPVGAL
jgi:hypothetical protein